jgi:hypothetical protein
MYAELAVCRDAGGDTTLVVWADVDDDLPDAEALEGKFWDAAHGHGVQRPDFDRVVFVFAKDRIENWTEFLDAGGTDEGIEGPRAKPDEAAAAARRLADLCAEGEPRAFRRHCSGRAGTGMHSGSA